MNLKNRTGKKLRPIVYYVTAHGYGHGVRSAAIIDALDKLYPDIPIILTTDLPPMLFEKRLKRDAVTIRPGTYDVGMIQHDSIRTDPAATLNKVLELYSRRPKIIQEEANFLREIEAAMVVVDIPEMPIEAAKMVGIPAIAVGNFAWDWIYSAAAAADKLWFPLIEQFAAGYGKADLLCRLPFAEEMVSFPRREDFPLVASPGQPRREELAKLTGCSTKRPWILLSFTSLDWSAHALSRVEHLTDYEFFTVLPLGWENYSNMHPIDRRLISFSDVLASVDAVISKPGFSLVSECIVNKKPIIYTDRNDFPEYPLLVKAIERYLQNIHIPQQELYKGDLLPSLEKIWLQPKPKETISCNGAELIARRIIDFYPLRG